jgi:signal transduction histidine kinase
MSRSGERLPLPRARDEVHRLGRTLNLMLDRLDAGLRRERRFVAEASHELRTPLALLRLELDLALSRPRSPDELLEALRSTDEEVRRLSALAEDLLTLAASGEDRPAPEPVDVRALVRSVADRFASRAAADGRRIVVHDDGVGCVRGDAGRLDRALSNLVDNALRHGVGTVEVGAHATGGTVAVSVGDEGPGLDERVRPVAFDRFTRAAKDRATPGHGLGLAIVEAIVAEHDGEVRVDAAGAGTGTRITMTLPSGE